MVKILHRKLYSSVIQQIEEKEFAIITGARQTGKTTILKQVYDFLQKNGRSAFYLTLEDPDVLSRLNQHPEHVFDFVIRPNGDKIFLLLDEVQYLDKPSNFLKLLFDKHHETLKIIATGSSAFYLDKKFTDSLAGRKKLFDLFTLDFEEFLHFKTEDESLRIELDRIRTNENYISARQKELESFMNEYMTYGGYPAVVLADNEQKKTEILKELTGSFLKRDIAEAQIQDQEKFYRLLLILADQTGSLLNMNELSRLLSLSVTAVENYIFVLQKCFHIRLLKPFYKNIRKELTKMPKVYFNDMGFRNVLLKLFIPVELRLDKGALIENYAVIRAVSKYGSDAVRFWRTTEGNEIDMVVTTTFNKGLAIEVKYDAQHFNPSKYQKFVAFYPGYVLSYRALRAAESQHSLLGF
ncbi:MAG: ATP-binding protein [Bacteroidales bacterium]|nr:ATP-binding protein [Bacteroidales bacterium]